MTKSGPKLEDRPKSRGKTAAVPYGPPQPEPSTASAPATRSGGSAGRTVLKVGAAIALPFVLRAIFKAVSK